MKQIEINWQELTSAFEEDDSWDSRSYFDTETGTVLYVTSESSQLLEDMYEQLEKDTDSSDFQAALVQTNLPDWQKIELFMAFLVEEHFGERVIAIPNDEGDNAYGQMVDFIETVENGRLRKQLSSAIRGRGAFGRFRRTLEQNLAEQERWYAFGENRLQDRVLEWLREIGIEPTNLPKSKEADNEKMREIRQKLLDEALCFTQMACQLPNVTRIALIGSLTTDKLDPKDVDMLVTVTDGSDLTELATLGRKLSGHCQQMNRGGEIFLADERNNYLGRICPWKTCAPGIRSRCDALNCGKRPFLHDDFGDIKLHKSLITKPPVGLWPQIVTRVPIPDDLYERVLQKIES